MQCTLEYWVLIPQEVQKGAHYGAVKKNSK